MPKTSPQITTRGTARNCMKMGLGSRQGFQESSTTNSGESGTAPQRNCKRPRSKVIKSALRLPAQAEIIKRDQALLSASIVIPRIKHPADRTTTPPMARYIVIMGPSAYMSAPHKIRIPAALGKTLLLINVQQKSKTPKKMNTSAKVRKRRT